MDTQLSVIAGVFFMFVGMLVACSPGLTVEVSMSAEATRRLKLVANLFEFDDFVAVHAIPQFASEQIW